MTCSPLAVAAGLVALWLRLPAVLWHTGPEQARLADGLRLLPDMIRMLRRLAADPELPRGVRVRLGLRLAYLLSPIDVIPDFIPVRAAGAGSPAGLIVSQTHDLWTGPGEVSRG
jgi:hypothetical protein